MPFQAARAYACAATSQNEARFYLIEDVPKFTKFMNEPIRAAPGTAPLDTPGYFVAGIVKGYLEAAGFEAECAPRQPPCTLEP